jgi:SNF2 family DNA or RNA helicase
MENGGSASVGGNVKVNVCDNKMFFGEIPERDSFEQPFSFDDIEFSTPVGEYLVKTFDEKDLQNFNKQDTENLIDCDWNSFCVVNYEYFRSYKGERLEVDCCIFDEVHKLKNVNSAVHKCIQKYIKPVYALNLTGTPITKDYMDLFGILTCTGEPYFRQYNAAQFRARYITNGGNKRTQELMCLIEEFSVFGDLTEYVDMPDAANIVIPVKLSLEQYAELNFVYNSHDYSLTRINKAAQITSGIYDKLSPKQCACIQLINDLIADNEKVVLFCRFNKEFDFFMNYYRDIAVGLNGATKDRELSVSEFQNNPKCKLFVGNLQTAGTGITLTAASKCIFYSQTYRWEDFEQSKARIYRIGQTQNCLYYHLIAIDSVDELMYNSNINKTNLIEDFRKRYGGI